MGNFLKVTCVAALAGICAASGSTTPDQPPSRFEDIPARNIFGLKNAEVRPDPAPPQKQLPKLILTGITTILGNKRALLKELPLSADGKTPDANKELLLMLTEGQRDGDVEVLQIDEKAGTVKLKNAGTFMTLNFERDGPKPPTGAPGAALPTNAWAGAAIAQGAQFPLPPGYTNANIHPLPTRTTRSQSAAQVPPPPLPGVAANAAAEQAATPGLTTEEQKVLLEAQRQAMQYPTSNLPNNGSGTFTTPAQEGIQPAFAPPPPGVLPGTGRPIVPQ